MLIYSISGHILIKSATCHFLLCYLLHWILKICCLFSPLTSCFNNLIVGVLLINSRLKIWHCHCSCPGCCFDAGSVPGLGTSACSRHGKKKKKKVEYLAMDSKCHGCSCCSYSVVLVVAASWIGGMTTVSRCCFSNFIYFPVELF